MSLLPELAARQPSDELWVTEHGTVVMVGPEVTDAEALDQLRLPADETAIEVPLRSLPELDTGVGR